MRSGRACGVLRKNGFEQVYNLAGGITAWERANMPMEK
jgi:rhodanese-related sulfurtransferase